MPRRAIKFLEDIRHAGATIQRLTQGLSESDYVKDEGLQFAVERGFEIIGEAVRRLTEGDPAITARISYARQIVDFRNVIAHGYNLVDDSRVWQIVQTNLPVLMTEVDALLNELASSL